MVWWLRTRYNYALSFMMKIYRKDYNWYITMTNYYVEQNVYCSITWVWPSTLERVSAGLIYAKVWNLLMHPKTYCPERFGNHSIGTCAQKELYIAVYLQRKYILNNRKFRIYNVISLPLYLIDLKLTKLHKVFVPL